MIILCGPSASGKTEICKCLCFNFGFVKFVTTTTRLKRIGEIDDVDYHFISKEDFFKKLKNNEFIETVEYNGNFYGTEKRQIGDNVILIIEPNGLKKFMSLNDPSIFSFYLTCSENKRIDRMNFRQDLEKDITSRIINDRKNFEYNEIKKDINFTIDTNTKTVYELSKFIYDTYIESLKKRN